MKNFNKVAAIAVAAGLLTGSGLAADINVPADFSTIQAAIDDAGTVDTDRILVDASSYSANEAVTIDKNLTLLSQNGKATITGTSLDSGVTVQAADVTIENFTISGAGFHGISIESGGALAITDCNVDGNGTSGSGGGSGLHQTDIGAATLDLTIANSTFSGNSHRGWTFDSPGTISIDASGVTIDGNTNEGVLLGKPGGLSVDFLLTNCDITNNGGAGMVDFFGTGTITGGSISTNVGHGLFLDDNASGPAARDYTIDGVTIMGNGDHGVIRFAAGNFIVQNCTIDGNGRGFAFNNAYGPISVTMTGGSVSDNATVGFQPDGGAGNLTANVTGTEFHGNGEMGLGIFGQGNYTFTNCSIQNNSTEGIARLFNDNGTSTILNLNGCTVESNQKVGILVIGMPIDVTLTDTSVSYNNVAGDSEGNILFDGDGVRNLVAERSTFVQGNGTKDNIALVGAGTHDFTNCLLDDGASSGGLKVVNIASADLIGNAEATLTHCTLVGSGETDEAAVTAEVFEGALNPASVTMRNCIVAGWDIGLNAVNGTNANASIDSDYNVLYCNSNTIGSGVSSGANDKLGQDPLFVTDSSGPGTGDFHLQAGSPAIDAGDTLGVTDDLDGAVRPSGSAPDMGAYEYGAVAGVTQWSLY
ncbi:right-handed parallel beta-helix repeat-containing protein [bacterium]|nr:right-handed parallel beta-helix repeat-containing protein [bacterium]